MMTWILELLLIGRELQHGLILGGFRIEGLVLKLYVLYRILEVQTSEYYGLPQSARLLTICWIISYYSSP
jgi:hypothetical protein